MSQRHTDLIHEIRLFISQIGGMSIPVDTPGRLYTRAWR